MRALLLALSLVWATLHSVCWFPVPSSRDGRPVLTNRDEHAVLIGSRQLHFPQVIERAPRPLPLVRLAGLWLPPASVQGPGALGFRLSLDRSLAIARAIQGLGSSRCSRGPPAGAAISFKIHFLHPSSARAEAVQEFSMSEMNESPLQRAASTDLPATSERTPISMVLVPLLLILALIVWYRFA